MPEYRLAPVELLKNQLLYTPRRVLRKHVVRLYDLVVFHISPHRTYPYDFVCHRITGYRPASDAEALLEGRDLIADLSQMLLELSRKATPEPEAFREPVYEAPRLAALLGTGPRTVLRWSDRASLIGCYVAEENGDRRLVFRFAAVLRFIRDNPALVDGALAGVLVSANCRDRVINAAHRSRKRSRSFDDFTGHLAEKLDLSPALVSFILELDREEHPELNVYRSLGPALSEDQEQRAAALFKDGRSVGDIASELGCSRRAVYGAVCRREAEDILAAEVQYIDSPEFHEPDAEETILVEPQSVSLGEDEGKPAKGLSLPEEVPPYIRDLYRTRLLSPERERWLFRKYNYVKSRMCELRDEIRKRRHCVSLIRKYRGYEAAALACRRELMRSNLRLVVSIAKRHLGPNTNFETLVSDGNMSLLSAIEKFDYTRGFKFSTYASWAIIKNFAKSIPEENYRLRTYVTGVSSELMEATAADRAEEPESSGPFANLREVVSGLLSSLSEREQFILAARFGLARGGVGSLQPQTLEQIGNHLSLSRERVRQLEKRALDRLREMMDV